MGGPKSEGNGTRLRPPLLKVWWGVRISLVSTQATSVGGPKHSGFDSGVRNSPVSTLAHTVGGPKLTGFDSGPHGGRSGAKGKTRCGWPLPRTQFFGRWAGPTVLSFVEEALAEVTHTWSFAASSASAPSAPPPLALCDDVFGTDASTPLADRLVAADAAIEDLRSRLSQVEQIPRGALEARLDRLEEAPSPEDQLVMAMGKAHIITVNTLELPRPYWVALCGWRCGIAASVQLLPRRKLDKSGRALCSKCQSKEEARM